jgi:hypothetical protein
LRVMTRVPVSPAIRWPIELTFSLQGGPERCLGKHGNVADEPRRWPTLAGRRMGLCAC